MCTSVSPPLCNVRQDVHSMTLQTALRDRIPQAVCATWDPNYRPKDESDREDDDVASEDNEHNGDWVDDNKSTHSLSISLRSIVEIPASKAKGKGFKPTSPGTHMDCPQQKSRHSLPFIVPPALKRKRELDKDSGPVAHKKLKDSRTGQSNALFTQLSDEQQQRHMSCATHPHLKWVLLTLRRTNSLAKFLKEAPSRRSLDLCCRAPSSLSTPTITTVPSPNRSGTHLPW